MLKIVLLFALIVVISTAPTPGLYHHHAPLAFAAIPAAVSHSSRVDYHTPIIATYHHAPILASPIISAPIINPYGYSLFNSYGLHGW